MYRPVQFDSQAFPRCLASKELIVTWDGDVPLYALTVQQVGAPGVIAGNVADMTFDELRNGGIKQYRDGHRDRDPSKMKTCRGCSGV